MLRHLMLAMAASVVLSAATPATAAITLYATMTNAGEPGNIVPTLQNGDPRPASFGQAVFVISDDLQSMAFTAVIFNIDVTGTQTPDPNDNLTNAHIHAGTTATPTWPVVWGFHGTPQNDTNPADHNMIPFGSGVGGFFTGIWNAPEGNNTTLAAQLNNLLTEHAYINFHTTQFPGGEIRGTLVPEPSGAFLLAAAAALALLPRSRQSGLRPSAI